jgi:magnesium transporter
VLVLTQVDSEQITERRRRDEFFWLDLAQPSDEELDALREALDLHPMALEDTREFGQRPKVDAYQDYVLIVFFSARKADEPERVVHPVEVHVYVSGAWIVTVHREPLALLERLHDELEPAGTHEEDYLVYRILDGLTDSFFPAVSAIEERIDALEAEVLERPRRELLGRVYRRKQEVHELQRLIAGQRDQFQTASERILELAGLSRGTREYLRDIGDHLAQIGGELQRQNDDLTALTGIYFNASAERVNRTATRLSVVATFFVVWTLITGFFGQNFQWLVDNVESRGDFLLFGVGGLVVPTVALATVLWVKRHDWF